MRIGLYLQDKTVEDKRAETEFYQALNLAKNAKLDLFVFPEHAWTPFDNELEELAILNYDDEESDIDEIYEIVTRIAKLAGCAIVFSRADNGGAIYSCFVNPFASDNETTEKYYLKHVATNLSALDLSDYEDSLDDFFSPVILKGYKIGQTICYDSTMPLFSRAYGLNQVDVIINSTGGHVDYKKWSYYQKSRALENRCSVLCTMAYFDNDARNSSYVFGYDSCGKKLDYSILGNSKSKSNNLRNVVYVFDVQLRPSNYTFNINKFEVDEYISQTENINKNSDILLHPHELVQKLPSLKRLDENLFLLPQNGQNVIICYIKGDSILRPEVAANLLYSNKLSAIADKRYIILNDWDFVEPAYYERVLSSILRVRAAENFCAVILNSKNIVKCFQVGNNKNSQIVKMDRGGFGIDLSRTTGPEAVWKNKAQIGMRGEWRHNYENLLNFINDNATQITTYAEQINHSNVDLNSSVNASANKDGFMKRLFGGIGLFGKKENTTIDNNDKEVNANSVENPYQKFSRALCSDSTGAYDDSLNHTSTTIKETKTIENCHNEIAAANAISTLMEDNRLSAISQIFYQLSENDKNRLLQQAELFLRQAKSTTSRPELEIIEHKLELDEGTGYLGVVGRLRNNSNKKFEFVSVEVVFYDEAGNQVWSDSDNTLKLRSGGTWKFRVDALDFDVKSYEIEIGRVSSESD